MKRMIPVALAACVLALTPSPASAAFGISSFDGGAFDSLGNPDNQASSHPHEASAKIVFNTIPHAGLPSQIPAEDVREIQAVLPPGLIGNPTAAPTCPLVDFIAIVSGENECPDESVVGINFLTIGDHEAGPQIVEIYNLESTFGTAAKFGFIFASSPFIFEASLSPTPPYSAVLRATNISQVVALYATELEVWGVPADHGTGAPRRPFLSLPTSCAGPVRTDLAVTGWLGGTDSAFFLSHGLGGPGDLLPIVGCNSLAFEPSLEARPTTSVADSPSGLDVDLEIPQSEDPDGKAVAHLKDTTVTLPEGLTVNPASANGLDGCAAAEVNLNEEGAAKCPDASKLATVQVDTPLLDHPVKGAAYLADPYQNPFNSLLALYIVLDDPQSGTVVKLAGEVTPNSATGRLSATFTENPQVPFEHFKLHFFGGAGGSLKTPSTCGPYTTTSQMTPWSAPDSGPPASPSDTWSIDQGPGGACASTPAALPHAPAFDAGAVNPIAGAHSPFVLHLRRDDGSQNFAALNVTPPPGLVAKLAGTAICPDPAIAAAAAKSGNEEKTSPSCPAASEVGSVTAGAGAGPAPYYAPGKAYLTGPYKGAPLSLAIVTPATAGPFDLGTVVVRTALYVDSRTAQVNAVSDAIPQMLQGIPLDVRTVDIALDRPSFMLNPTSCDPMAVTGQLTSTLGAIAPLSNRFQLGECGRLGFKPTMTLRLKGGTRRGDHPALTATLKPRPGDANIASVSVALPRSEFLDQSHIGTVCTRVQFAADQCPAKAIYGKATVTTPILDYPLAGNVYLRSSDNLLPDLVPDLRGPAHQPLRIESAGRTDSIKGGIRNSFDFVPDAPFSKLVVRLPAGKKGLLVNSRNICQKAFRATVKYTAHNGLTYVDRPPLRARCAKEGTERRPKRHRRR